MLRVFVTLHHHDAITILQHPRHETSDPLRSQPQPPLLVSATSAGPHSSNTLSPFNYVFRP